jgi:hypothetical protein
MYIGCPEVMVVGDWAETTTEIPRGRSTLTVLLLVTTIAVSAATVMCVCRWITSAACSVVSSGLGVMAAVDVGRGDTRGAGAYVGIVVRCRVVGCGDRGVKAGQGRKIGGRWRTITSKFRNYVTSQVGLAYADRYQTHLPVGSPMASGFLR